MTSYTVGNQGLATFFKFSNSLSSKIELLNDEPLLRFIIYRVSQKKGGLVFRARFDVFRGFNSKKFRRLTLIKI